MQFAQFLANRFFCFTSMMGECCSHTVHALFSPMGPVALGAHITMVHVCCAHLPSRLCLSGPCLHYFSGWAVDSTLLRQQNANKTAQNRIGALPTTATQCLSVRSQTFNSASAVRSTSSSPAISFSIDASPRPLLSPSPLLCRACACLERPGDCCGCGARLLTAGEW